MVLIDIDGVIADTHTPFIEAIRREGYDVSIDDITAYNFGQLREKTGFTTSQCIERLWDVWRYNYRKIEPLDDEIVNVVKFILDTYDSEIITANPISSVKDWLVHVGIPTCYFKVSDDKTNHSHKVLIEDNPTLSLRDQVLVLRDRPWNRQRHDSIRFHYSKELIPVLSNMALEGLAKYRTTNA